MARFCGNCGAEVEEDAKVCGNCGVPLDGESAPDIDTGEQKLNLRSIDFKKYIPVAVGVIIAVVVLFVVVNVVKNNTGYRATLNRAFDSVAKGDVNGVINEMSSYVEDVYDDGYGDIEDVYEKRIDDILDHLEDEVGANPKISYEVKKASKLSDRKLEKLKEEMENMDDNYDGDDIKSAYNIDIKLNVKGPDDDYHENVNDIIVLKEAGAWKIKQFGSFGL